MEIIVIIVIALLLLNCILTKKEGFSYCSNCCHKSHRQCINCTNCGVCIKGGRRYCEPGDANGPFNRIDCDQWLHGWRNPSNNQQIFF
jgi:hypothetical protein